MHIAKGCCRDYREKKEKLLQLKLLQASKPVVVELLASSAAYGSWQKKCARALVRARADSKPTSIMMLLSESLYREAQLDIAAAEFKCRWIPLMTSNDHLTKGKCQCASGEEKGGSIRFLQQLQTN